MKKILFLFTLAALLSACDTSTTTSDTTPTPIINWTTIHTYNGNGNAMTKTFTVGPHWKIKWSCDPNSAQYGTYNFIAYRHKTPVTDDKTIPDADINSICNSASTSGETEESGAGSYYLEMDVPNDWSITIQEPK